MNASVLALGALIAATVMAAAQRAMPDQGNGRYSLVPRGEEFLRLDSRTGEVSICAWRGAGWACVGLPDDRAAYEAEIGRLMQENERLKRQLSVRDRASRDTAKPDQGQVRTAPPPVAEPATSSAPPKQEPPKQESPPEPARAPATTVAPEAGADSAPALAPISPPAPEAEPQPPGRPPETRAPETPSTIAPSGKERARVESSPPPPQAPSGSRTEKDDAQRNAAGAFDRALAVFERAWRQLVDAVRRLP